MTTAHRPTFTAARAGNSEHGNWSSGGVRSMNKPARDMPTHLVMKYRSGSQLVHEMDSAILKANLDERELGASRTVQKKDGALLLKDGTDLRQGVSAKPQLLLGAEEAADLGKYDDGDDPDDSDDDSSDDDDDDDELALQLELEKIKKEREEERTRREVEAAADALQAQAEASLTNNPLLNEPTGAIKRKWNDDVVFRNQARGLSDSTQKRQFVNDTIRSDFHKRFLAKYIN
mmetsp:Transcript_10018/g.33053  ORF Transcript_10018/g.33053 Transcript_10018/m.33053 type:complete len:232 (-) Transcript_10018:38-733(-)